jgi:CheY-like chemotaxis protein
MAAKSLLVVDDEAEFCDFVRAVAEGLGYRVETCTSGRQAVARFDATRPDLVVLDVVMPDVEGIQIVQELADRNAAIRVVMVTGFNPGYAEAARTIGSARGIARIEILIKPVRVEQLRAVLRAA